MNESEKCPQNSSTNGDNLETRTFDKLLELEFKIPSYQRGYRWTEIHINDLLNDLLAYVDSKEKNGGYYLQPLVVYKNKDKNNSYTVVDGQQRLTTMFLIYKYLKGENAYTLTFDRDIDRDIDNKRWKFLYDLNPQNLNSQTKDDNKNIDLHHISKAYEKIEDWFNQDQDKINKFNSLLTKDTQKNIFFLWYEIDKDKEHETFRNINSGKIPLTNSDLIKAVFLNKTSGLEPEMHKNVALQLEEMERYFNNDHFWAMLSSSEPKYPQTRIDLLFNLTADKKEDEVDRDFLSSFRWFSDRNNGELKNKWKKTRKTFLYLLDLYEDTETYHYISYLTYCTSNSHYKFLQNVLEKTKEPKNEIKKHLKDRIKKVFTDKNSKDKNIDIDKLTYNDNQIPLLRKLFVLHNVETILQKYKILSENEDLNLQHEYEQFPFELLYKQKWDIEHISPQTDSKFKNDEERANFLLHHKSYVKNLFNDLSEQNEIKEHIKEEMKKIGDSQLDIDNIKETLQAIVNSFKESNTTNSIVSILNKDGHSTFDSKIYPMIILYDEKMKDSKIEEKNNIGNLVLLDSHTNRAFHNAFFNIKRKFVIIASGQKKNGEKSNYIKQLYIPPCTVQCFTKAYNTNDDVKLDRWTKVDADAYKADIKEKLKSYFSDNNQETSDNEKLS